MTKTTTMNSLMKSAMKKNASRKKFQGDGFKLAELLYGPPKTKTTQQVLPFGKAPEDQGEKEAKR